MRVPVPDGSVTDLVATVRSDVTMEQVNEAFRRRPTEGSLAGKLVYTEDPIVSSDIVGTPASCTFDSLLTMVIGRHGEDRRLVRQRMGLLEPARGSRRAGRELAASP